MGPKRGDEMQAGSTDTSKGEGEGKKRANEACLGRWWRGSERCLGG